MSDTVGAVHLSVGVGVAQFVSVGPVQVRSGVQVAARRRAERITRSS